MTPALQIDLTNKVLLVTGAAGGIGQIIVNRSLAAGARVAAFDLRAAQLGDHPNLLKLSGDATDETTVRNALAQIQARWNRLDILVNSAGIVGSGHVETLALDDWQRVLTTNLTSTFLFCKHAIPLLRQSKGSIVSMSSTNGLTGGSHLSGPAYAAAKAGIIALTKNIARDLAKDGVRANAIAPGPIETPMLERLGEEMIAQLQHSIPLGELGTADDVADLVFFLSSAAAKHITGITISLSGGLVM